MTKIESSSNPIIKQVKKLLTSAGRKKQGFFILEGERLVSDSVKLGADIEYILISESFKNAEFPKDIKVYTVSDRIFDELKSTVNSQGVLAVAKYRFAGRRIIDGIAIFSMTIPVIGTTAAMLKLQSALQIL